MLILLLTMQEILTLIGGLLVIYFVYIIVTQRDDNVAVDAKSAVYTAIRKLVDHAVDEVQKLPSLENSGSGNGYDDAHRDFSRKNKDNLLATVIVNKVIAKCQSEQTGNGNVSNLKEADRNFFKASETSQVDGQSQSCDRSLELPQKNLQAISVASKFTQTQPSELSSLMYEERIEEVASYISEKYISNDSYDDLDFCNSHRVPFPELGIDIINQCSDLLEDDAIDTSYAKTLSLPHSWKENWYFRKRNSDGTKAAVSMFVPNSNADYRALIGDKDIDETSDLSEYSTYSDDEVETDLALTIKNTFAEDNACGIECNGVQSTDASATAVKSISRREDKLFNVAENTTDENFNSNFKPGSSSSHSSSSSLKCEIPKKPSEFQEENNEIFKEDQRDRECGEHNTLVPRRHCNGIHDDANISLVSVVPDVSVAEKEKTDGSIENGVVVRINGDITDGIQNGSVPRADDDLVDDFNLFAPPIPGSIADREHKKWENAVPIENNPYSSENIQKRLVQQQYSPISTVLSSSYDITINGSEFHALGEDKYSSPEPSEDDNITRILENNNSEEKNENVSKANSNNELISPDYAKETLHNDQLQTTPSLANQDRSTRGSNNNKPSDSEDVPSIILEGSQVPSKLTNGHRPKNTLSNTQLIKSYFENGERKEDTRDVSPKKGKNNDGNRARKKTSRSKQENSLKNSRPLEASLTSEVEHNIHADDDNIDDKIIALPSVKKIVQAFNEKIQEKSLSNNNLTPQKAPNKSESGDEQVEKTHVRRTQLHLHSLTARSMSREFREGLRQVPKKV